MESRCEGCCAVVETVGDEDSSVIAKGAETHGGLSWAQRAERHAGRGEFLPLPELNLLGTEVVL
jgi:hypothetical protein